MKLHSIRGLSTACASICCVAGAPATAQFGNAWVSFVPAPAFLVAAPISDASTETDLAAADADGDGWVDVAVARKQPFLGVGKRTNVFLRNESGVLADRTAQFASAADVPGDLGFLTPTNDMDIRFADVDGDGWLDMVTAVSTSTGDPKHIGHPRVYRNLGAPVGSFAGFRFEDARIPQLLHLGSGLPQNPWFTEVAPGDVTGDGFADLFFADHDFAPAGPLQPAGEDLNNRMLVNGGTGYFVDESQVALPPDMQVSGFAASAEIVDLNSDGAQDVLEDEGLTGVGVYAYYNGSPATGSFESGKKLYSFAPYYASTGDLNNDGRPDVVVTDDNTDRYLYHLGNDVQGKASFSPAKTFQFLSGSDDGFGQSNLVVDLDLDGWRDALVCDVDVDIPGCTRRLHVYHNPGGAVGDLITLREERELPGTSEGPGWLGAVGLYNADLEGTYGVEVVDVDRDGDGDLLVSRCTGTAVFENETVPAYLCQPDIGFGGPGSAQLTLCGQPLLPGKSATLRLSGAPPLTIAGLAVGVANNPIPILGGMLVPSDLLIVQTVDTDAAGAWGTSIPGGAATPTKVYFQVAYLDTSLLPYLIGFTSAIEAEFGP